MTLFNTLKRLFISLVGMAFFGVSAVHGAGTVPLAMSVQVDSSGAISAGCQLNFFIAGTVATPQNAFADFALTQPLSNPLVCDQSGRLPMFWLADGLIHLRLTTSTGDPIVDTTMQVLGPSSGGGGGGGTVDPTSIMSTGDMKARYGTGAIAGFVRLNGLTIGTSVSGATERANADTQALFVYLYTADTNLPVSGGRSGNALADFNANKQLTLPDWAGRALAALDDMGAGAKGRLTATYFGTAATVLGAAGGNEKNALSSTLQLPQFTPSVAANNLTYGVQGSYYSAGSPVAISAADGVNNGGLNQVPVAGTITLNAIGSASPSPLATASPAKLATFYIKL